jgi:hypothetical protein
MKVWVFFFEFFFRHININTSGEERDGGGGAGERAGKMGSVFLLSSSSSAYHACSIARAAHFLRLLYTRGGLFRMKIKLVARWSLNVLLVGSFFVPDVCALVGSGFFLGVFLYFIFIFIFFWFLGFQKKGFGVSACKTGLPGCI